MYERLLVPVDGTELSERAMHASIELARKLGASITGFVAEPFVQSPIEADTGHAHRLIWRDSDAQQHAQGVLSLFQTLAAEAGVAFTGHKTQSAQVAAAIVAAAEQHGCDTIVMASHQRNALSELLWGSHTREVMSHTALPVLVLR